MVIVPRNQVCDPADAERLTPRGSQAKSLGGQFDLRTRADRVSSADIASGPYLKGMAYIKPPLLQAAFRPRSSFNGLAWPTLRSKISA